MLTGKMIRFCKIGMLAFRQDPHLANRRWGVMIKSRLDLEFLILAKRIDRFTMLPGDVNVVLFECDFECDISSLAQGLTGFQ
jgi:hypothetical protein